MSLVPLVLLYLARGGAKGAQRKKGHHGPHWPAPHHATPKKHSHKLPRVPEVPPMKPMHHESAHEKHETPAEHAHAEDRHVDVHRAEPVEHHATHHDHATHLHTLHEHGAEPAHASEHVEQHQAPRKRKRKRVTRLPVQHITARAPADIDAAGNANVSALQRVLVKLGWRGHLTTKGALSSKLTDGEYGATTHDDWMQSAHKRNLDPLIERIGPNTARVNPKTYAVLKSAAAAKSSVSGIRIP
jgi:hypothetical protein